MKSIEDKAGNTLKATNQYIIGKVSSTLIRALVRQKID